MPWQEVDTVTLRKQFVMLAIQEGSNISLLCRHFKISRDKGYKWLRPRPAWRLPPPPGPLPQVGGEVSTWGPSNCWRCPEKSVPHVPAPLEGEGQGGGEAATK
jgi:hypothetical protein